MIAAGRLARHDTGGVRLCKAAFDPELPLTVITEAYAATDERRAIKVNRESQERFAELLRDVINALGFLLTQGRTALS